MWYFALFFAGMLAIVEKGMDGGFIAILQLVGMSEIAFAAIVLGIALQLVAMSFDRAQAKAMSKWK